MFYWTWVWTSTSLEAYVLPDFTACGRVAKRHTLRSYRHDTGVRRSGNRSASDRVNGVKRVSLDIPFLRLSQCTGTLFTGFRRGWIMITTIVSVAVAAAHQEKVGVSSRELVREYVAMHSVATAELVSSVRKAPCARRFISADFWGRGLGNSVNTPLNALALAIATNRTLLISTDKQYEAGFWRYLGDLAWARECRLVAWLTCGTGKDEVLEA